ncbi:MAG TPA: sulfotransferase [Candidatus Binataceae bacterium]|nr:sulfotransferase [Candidatus Binataceae bacterium]
MHEIWPNFFLVGAAKAGTTSLYAYLSQHPDVFFPAVKEPHFFTQVRPSADQRFFIEAITKRSAYLRLFAGARGHAVIGDASPSYLWHEEAPVRIRETVPHARIAMILRDPLERAYSHYLMDYREGVQHRTFYDALVEDMRRPDRGWGVSYLYYELGLYSEQVRRYLDTFRPERVKIMLFDEFRSDVKAALGDISRFLGLDPAPLESVDTSTTYNSYAAPRNQWMRRLAGAKFSRMIGQTIVPRSVGAFIFQRMFLKNAQKPPLDGRARDLLCSLYEPDLDRLERLLGRSLPELRKSWKPNTAGVAINA